MFDMMRHGHAHIFGVSMLPSQRGYFGLMRVFADEFLALYFVKIDWYDLALKKLVFCCMLCCTIMLHRKVKNYIYICAP